MSKDLSIKDDVLNESEKKSSKYRRKRCSTVGRLHIHNLDLSHRCVAACCVGHITLAETGLDSEVVLHWSLGRARTSGGQEAWTREERFHTMPLSQDNQGRFPPPERSTGVPACDG